MSKKRILYIALVVIAASVVAYFYLLPYFGGEDEMNKVYTVDDFPTGIEKVSNGSMSQEILDGTIEELNEQYVKIKEGDHIYNRWINIGILRKRLGDHEGTEKAWLKAIEYSPDQSLAYGNLADLYLFILKDDEKAEEYYLKVISMRNDNYNYYIGLSALYRYNMTEKAHLIEGIIVEAAEINPNEAASYYIYLADYYSRDGNDVEKARKYANKVIEIDPELKDQLPSNLRELL